ncbi:hypothetical protein EV176_007635, partial [Coemansia sp. RSA 451]
QLVRGQHEAASAQRQLQRHVSASRVQPNSAAATTGCRCAGTYSKVVRRHYCVWLGARLRQPRVQKESVADAEQPAGQLLGGRHGERNAHSGSVVVWRRAGVFARSYARPHHAAVYCVRPQGLDGRKVHHL